MKNSKPGGRRRPTVSEWAERGSSAIHGRGLYAAKAIPDGMRVIEYLGERITKAEADRREQLRLKRDREGGDGCVYIFVLNKRHDLDGTAEWNTARLMNHSCRPNCRTETVRGRIWVIARREIAAGEELTFDYGYSFRDWRLHPCRCGTDRCAGFIVGSEQRWRVKRILRVERAEARKAERVRAQPEKSGRASRVES